MRPAIDDQSRDATTAHSTESSPTAALSRCAPAYMRASKISAGVSPSSRRFDQVKFELLDVALQGLGGGFLGDLVAEHFHIAAERCRAERILGLAAPDTEDFRRIPDRISEHANARALGHQEVAGLVHDDQNAEDYDGGKD